MSDTTNARDRLTEVRVQGMRAIADVRLRLDGLTVLIGDNGTGKSSLVEALELLRTAARPGNFLSDQVLPLHGGLSSLVRAGATTLRIGARIEGAGAPMEYAFALSRHGSAMVVSEERLDLWQDSSEGEPLHIIDRDPTGCRVIGTTVRTPTPVQIHAGQLALTWLGMDRPEIARVVDVLNRGSVHVPFHVQPVWVAKQRNPLREPAIVNRTEHLERLGQNLANCYHMLSTNALPGVWQRTLDRVRAGLGVDVADVKTPPASRGEIELMVQFRSVPDPIPASALSDGQLTYLAFVALAELGKSASFLAFDEPESHLHPELLVRVVWLLEELSRSCPVVICTHSDRLLDALSDPANSVVLCELDEHRAARLYRPNPEALTKWLERYRGFGALRSEGYGPHVLTEAVEGGS